MPSFFSSKISCEISLSNMAYISLKPPTHTLKVTLSGLRGTKKGIETQTQNVSDLKITSHW